MARDEDIGRIEAESIKVQRIEEVIAATKAVTQELEELINKTERIRVGQELILGQEVEEE